MQFIKACTVLSVFALSVFVSYAQMNPITIRGVVKDITKEPIEGATIKVDNLIARSERDGSFSVSASGNSDITIEISAVGKRTLRKNFPPRDVINRLLTFTLIDENNQIESVDILGLSKVDEINKSAFNVTAIDAKKMHNSSIDVGQALNRVAGVKVRESGGLGSQVSLSLNGYSGNQLKIFLDGLPIDNYGSSFQINNIPINYVDRIEVYKGVVPIWLGGDALGGAVNLVKSTKVGNYLDASYSFGSFNTHRATLNTGFILNNGFTMELSAYKNYSDNNYWVNVDVSPDINTGVTVPDRVRRFHDTYKNQMLNFNVGVSQKSWADQLLIGINLGDNHADIQTGNRMPEVYGARFREGNIIQPTFTYRKKDLLAKGLDLSVVSAYNLGEEKSVDTVYRRFNWYGESIPKGDNTWDAGGERAMELYRYKNNNANVAANLSYPINPKNAIYTNSTFTSSNRKGFNALQPDNDFYKQPKITKKYITGIGFSNTSIKNLENSVFIKHFHQYVQAYSVYNNIYSSNDTSRNLFGYGLASTYHFSDNTQVKLSYEKAYRTPELNELFGDVINLEANPALKPESSRNLNLGASHYFLWKERNALSINANLLYREAKDYIRYVLSAVNFDGVVRQVAQNQRDVRNVGAEAELRYVWDRKFSVSGNITYQNLRNQTKYENGQTDVSTFYKDRLPNIPYLFGSADVAYTWKDKILPRSNLRVGYSLFYVHSYFLRWPSAGALGKETIPKQLSHDVAIDFSFAGGRYNIGVDGRNLADALLYDNYMLQKPSRNFNVKFRYVLN